MAGDLGIEEMAVLEGTTSAAAALENSGRVIHRYGRVSIVAGPELAKRGSCRGALSLQTRRSRT